MSHSEVAFQQCISPACGKVYAVADVKVACDACGNLLDVRYDWDRARPPSSLSYFEDKWRRRDDPHCFSGVWRFHELLPFVDPRYIVSVGEGQTLLQRADALARYTDLDAGGLYLQYEGMNPSGSFKDNGMSAAFSHACQVGAQRAACASTGNTSASLAMYCSVSQLMKAVIFIGSGKIAYGKLSQALEFGALTVQIAGDFDDAMARVKQVSKDLGIYLVNSVNPFRLEGQKTIMFRVLEALRWEVPDWIVVPGGNLGNSSAFGKAFSELHELGLIDRIPRLAVINAAGASTLYELYHCRGVRWQAGRADLTPVCEFYDEMDRRQCKASTIASAIEINRPVNLNKCLRALEACDGVVRQVSDQEILDAKAQVGATGIGCEPASAASVAGTRRLREEGVIGKGDRVVCVLTGHQLKDPTATVAYHTTDQEMFNDVLAKRGVQRASFANRAVAVPNDLDAIMRDPTVQLRDRGMEPIRIGISGAAGRMGRRLVALALQDPQLGLVAALESNGHPQLGHDAGAVAGERPCGIEIADQLAAELDVIVDFSVPAGAARATQLGRARKTALVIATTGLEDQHEREIHAAAQEVPVVFAPSMSLAVNLTMKLAALTGRALKSADADVEIVERHHRFKEDAPSGTALRFGDIIATEMELSAHQHGRQGQPGPRPHDEIGYHAVRTGDNPGEHTLIFGMLGETIELTVRASSRDCYASGALTAAKFAVGKSPGLYTMFDVLGLNDN